MSAKAGGQSFDNIVKKYVASTKIEVLFNELGESDIDTIVKNSVEAMKEMNIFHPDITMFNANFNRNKKESSLLISIVSKEIVLAHPYRKPNSISWRINSESFLTMRKSRLPS